MSAQPPQQFYRNRTAAGWSKQTYASENEAIRSARKAACYGTPLGQSVPVRFVEAEPIEAELERLRRENEAMRQLLERYAEAYNGDDYQDYQDAKWLYDQIAPTLQPDAGSDLLTKEQVLPLVEAIKKARTYCVDGTIAWEMDTALAHAKTLGFE